MSIFNRAGWAEEGRRQQSQERLENGELPLEAEGRLYHLKQSKRFFSSGINPSELWTLVDRGIRPVAQVTGSAVFRLGWTPDPLAVSTEMLLTSHGYDEVRAKALARLTQEALKLGAHGVVDIELISKRPNESGDLRDDTVEVSAQGTAIVWDQVKPPDRPFLTTISAIDLIKLMDGGALPVGVVAATSVWYEVAGFDTRWAFQSPTLGRSAAAYNSELKDYSEALYTARNLALDRIERQASLLEASGILGITADYRLIPHEVEIENQGTKERRHDLIVEFTVIGNAIRDIHGKDVDIDYAVVL